MSFKCELKEQPAQPVLSIRARTSVRNLPQVLGNGYGSIIQYICELGENPVGPPFTAYYNMDMENLDIELGFPVAKKLPGKGDINPGEIPGGKLGTCLYTGPYGDEMCHAYGALTNFIIDKGYEPTGVAYEMYLNDPTVTPPSELQTLIVFPLKN
ncbi:AraC family transcriptional regulator [Methanocella sp. CWC-04]|uniref:AraC family transcriptional regulator n=1 Tax=Methanooceanicella nereidis TaxID=2052831 RepID=A0AAP2RBV4_9EURY|nr:GyrI-like domain-containing protein [Methanocella sp. CWC-04]MCD1294066.1 AraC family transcriptional regulator [Methanocella sp. CWC-04]